MFSYGLAVTQIVIGGDQVIEQGFRSTATTNLSPFNGQDFLQGTFQRTGIDGKRCNARPSSTVTLRSLPARQVDMPCTFQLEQKAPADDILQLPVWLSPVPQAAQLLGDRRTASVPECIGDLLDEGNLISADCASTVCDNGVHGPLYSTIVFGTPEAT